MADLGKLSFAKLNNQNWQSWKFRMEMLLMREELWYVITTAKPATLTEQWKKDEQKARATIGLCVEDSQFSLVKGAKDAKEFWEQLRTYHEKSTMTSRVSLLKKLCSLNLCEGGDMEKHLQEIEELYDRLTTAALDLKEPLRIAMILRSLPDSYAGLVTALEGRPDKDLTMELVKSKLLDEYVRRKEKSGGSRSDVNAMKSSTPRRKQSGAAQDRKCFHCGKPGHLQRDCRSLAKQKKGDEERKRPEEKQSAKQAKNNSSGVCFMAGNTPRGSWFIDSGASCHMTSDESFFSTLTKETGPNVFLADGKVVKTAGYGEGTVLGVNGEGDAVDVQLVDVLYVPSLTSGLVSVDKLTASGFTAVFKQDGCEIRDATGSLTVVGERSGCLYRLKLAESSKKVEGKAHTPLIASISGTVVLGIGTLVLLVGFAKRS